MNEYSNLMLTQEQACVLDDNGVSWYFWDIEEMNNEKAEIVFESASDFLRAKELLKI